VQQITAPLATGDRESAAILMAAHIGNVESGRTRRIASDLLKLAAVASTMVSSSLKLARNLKILTPAVFITAGLRPQFFCVSIAIFVLVILGSQSLKRGSREIANNLIISIVSGGGGRTRTYEDVVSGFTVRPLCRSGHSSIWQKALGFLPGKSNKPRTPKARPEPV
jgi:hypothetical protein